MIMSWWGLYFDINLVQHLIDVTECDLKAKGSASLFDRKKFQKATTKLIYLVKIQIK